MVGALAMALLFGELGVRLFAPQNTLNRLKAMTPPRYRASEILPYELLPGSTGAHHHPEFVATESINLDGFRGEELLDDPAPRILAIGDSFTFGYGDENSGAYPARLQRVLRDKTRSDRLEVINAGFASGHMPDTYYAFLRARAAELAPDTIVLGLFVGNDIDELRFTDHVWVETDERDLPTRIKRGDVEVVDGYRWPIPFGRYDVPVLRNSHLAILVADALFVGIKSKGRTFSQSIYRRSYTPVEVNAFAVAERALVGCSEIAAELGANFLVALFPAREQVYPNDYDLRDYPGGEPDFDKPQRVLLEILERHDIASVDLLSAFRRGHESVMEPLYFQWDGHWSPPGNEYTAQLMADELMRRQWVAP